MASYQVLSNYIYIIITNLANNLVYNILRQEYGYFTNNQLLYTNTEKADNKNKF